MSEPQAAPNGNSLNPFSRRDEHSSRSILWYKVTTSLSYLLLVVTTLYYAFNAPGGSGSSHGHHDGKHPHNGKHSHDGNHTHNGNHSHHAHHAHHGRFWQHNASTPFAQNSIITSTYWLVLFAIQLFYAYALYASNATYVRAAANIGSHFVANNLLLFGFVHLFVRDHFWLAELLLIVNFFNLSAAYFRHSTSPRLIHIGTVSGPLAWNFVALYWVGALAVHSNHIVARIVSNVFIWGWAGYGVFFLAAYKDYTMGFALSVLSFSTAVGQFLTPPRVVQLQWIFAFSVGGLLFILSLAVGLPGILGRDPFPRGQIVSEDQERAPLLADD